MLLFTHLKGISDDRLRKLKNETITLQVTTNASKIRRSGDLNDLFYRSGCTSFRESLNQVIRTIDSEIIDRFLAQKESNEQKETRIIGSDT